MNQLMSVPIGASFVSHDSRRFSGSPGEDRVPREHSNPFEPSAFERLIALVIMTCAIGIPCLYFTGIAQALAPLGR
jgi:hypothetical protein